MPPAVLWILSAESPFFTIKKLLPDSFLLSATAFFLSMTAFLMMIRPDTLRFQSQAKAEISIV